MEYSKKIRSLWDTSLFGVCSTMGEYLGIASSKIRIYFIYLTFLTFGSPIFVYLVAAFWMNIHSIRRKSSSLQAD